MNTHSMQIDMQEPKCNLPATFSAGVSHRFSSSILCFLNAGFEAQTCDPKDALGQTQAHTILVRPTNFVRDSLYGRLHGALGQHPPATARRPSIYLRQLQHGDNTENPGYTRTPPLTTPSSAYSQLTFDQTR